MGINHYILPETIENLIKVELKSASCEKVQDDCLSENKELLAEVIPRFKSYLLDVAFFMWVNLPTLFSDEDKEKFTLMIMKEFTRTFLSWAIVGFQQEMSRRISRGEVTLKTPAVIEAFNRGEFKDIPTTIHAGSFFDNLTNTADNVFESMDLSEQIANILSTFNHKKEITDVGQ